MELNKNTTEAAYSKLLSQMGKVFPNNATLQQAG
jgi:hypothetical protein